jgi:hypothetical protein
MCVRVSPPEIRLDCQGTRLGKRSERRGRGVKGGLSSGLQSMPIGMLLFYVMLYGVSRQRKRDVAEGARGGDLDNLPKSIRVKERKGGSLLGPPCHKVKVTYDHMYQDCSIGLDPLLIFFISNHTPHHLLPRFSKSSTRPMVTPNKRSSDETSSSDNSAPYKVLNPNTSVCPLSLLTAPLERELMTAA